MVLNDHSKNKIIQMSFILSIFILYMHATNYELYFYDSSVASRTIIGIQDFLSVHFFGRFAVNLFFLFSGIFFFSKILILKDLFLKIKKRIFTIGIPYLFWAIITYIFYLIISSIPFLAVNINNMQASFTINDIVEAITVSKYSSQLWYLRQLMLYLCFTPIMYAIFLLNRNLSISIIFLILVFYLLGWDNNFMKLNRYFFFYLGSFISFFKVNAINRISTRLFSCLCLLSAFLISYITFSTGSGIFVTISYIILPICIWYSFDLLPINVNLIKFQKYSFIIFCAHRIPIEAIKKIFLLINNESLSLMFISYIINPLITLILIVYATKLLSFVFPRFTNLISGGRNS